MFEDRSSRNILKDSSLQRYMRELDTHQSYFGRGQTTSRTIINLACEAALLMRSYVGQPVYCKSRMDLTILMNRVIAGEFYSHNNRNFVQNGGSGFLGTGALEIHGVSEEQVQDLKILFSSEGKERKSTHSKASRAVSSTHHESSGTF